MDKNNIKNKACLSWTLEDYKKIGEESPECLSYGKTEGEIMETENIQEWANEQIRTMSIMKESYPQRYNDIYAGYVLDLEYLLLLGKISKEEKDELMKEENFSLGQ